MGLEAPNEEQFNSPKQIDEASLQMEEEKLGDVSGGRAELLKKALIVVSRSLNKPKSKENK